MLWPDFDWLQLERDSRKFFSGPDGYVVVEELPRSAGVTRSVVWLTHPDYVAAPVPLEFPSSELVLPAEVVLQRSGGLVAHVIGPDGAPASGAIVVTMPDLSRDDAFVEGDDRNSAAYVLRKSTITNPDGTAILDPFPRQQYVYAILGDQRSEPWIGNAPAKILLDLRATFSVGGAVHLGTESPIATDLRVNCSVRRGPEEIVLDRTQVRPDGTWGSVNLPVLKCDSYVFRLRGGDFAADQVVVAPPGAGAKITVDFHPQSGVTIPIQTIGETGQPLADSTVSVHWNIDGVWHWIGAKTGQDGIARFRNCLPGMIWVRARAAGFTAKLVDGLTVTEPPAEPIVVQLDRAGVIRGRCTHRGKPVSDFAVMFWREDPNTYDKLIVKNSENGSFVIEGAPLGEVVLLATSDECPRSEPVNALVTSNQPAEVSIELPEAGSGKGRVVDGLTGDPLTTATVQVLITHGITNLSLRPWKTAEHVDAQGSFEFRGFVKGENVIEVTAPGYATVHAARHGGSDPAPDFGVIGLFAKRSVEVQLLSEHTINFLEYRASLEGAAYVPDQTFSADGRISYAALDPGRYSLRVVFPVENVRFTHFTLLPDQNLRLDIPVHTRPITVEVLPEMGDEAPQWYFVKAIFTDLQGRPTHQSYLVPESRRVDVDGVTGTSMVVRVFDVDERPLAVEHVELTPTWPSLVQIRVPNDPFTWQIVDTSGTSIRGVRVILTSIDNRAGWNEQLITDETGECAANGIALDRVCVALFHPDHGFQPSTPVTLSQSEGRKRLSLVPRLRLRVALLERSAPVPGLEIDATDHQNVGWGLGNAYSDDRGIVTWGPVGAGDFKIYVRNPGYWRAEQLIHLENDASPIPIQVRRLGNVDINVKNGYGNPAGGVAIDLYSVEQGVWASTWVSTNLMPRPPTGLTTGDDGHLRINALPNGEFRWRATSPSGATSEGTVQVPPQGTAQLQITVP